MVNKKNWILTIKMPAGQTRRRFSTKKQAEDAGKKWLAYRKAFNMKGSSYTVEKYKL